MKNITLTPLTNLAPILSKARAILLLVVPFIILLPLKGFADANNCTVEITVMFPNQNRAPDADNTISLCKEQACVALLSAAIKPPKAKEGDECKMTDVNYTWSVTVPGFNATDYTETLEKTDAAHWGVSITFHKAGSGTIQISATATFNSTCCSNNTATSQQFTSPVVVSDGKTASTWADLQQCFMAGTAVQNSGWQFIVDGCTGVYGKIVPGNFQHCCGEHDQHFQTCDYGLDKANNDLSDCLNNVCLTLAQPLRAGCQGEKETMMGVVRALNNVPNAFTTIYEGRQLQVCVCCKE